MTLQWIKISVDAEGFELREVAMEKDISYKGVEFGKKDVAGNNASEAELLVDGSRKEKKKVFALENAIEVLFWQDWRLKISVDTEGYEGEESLWLKKHFISMIEIEKKAMAEKHCQWSCDFR